MKSLIYYAHSAQDKLGNLLPYEHWQTLQSHSVNVGEMAAEFARVFGAQEIACQTGQLHDLGKYSEAFNRRLHGGPSVDHATAGAKIAVERWGNVIGKLMAFCIAGHHAGLANGCGEGDNRSTLKQRLALRFGTDIPALDNLWQQEIKLPQNLSAPPLKADAHHPFFSYAFFTRMLYSCLVDADYLDTEAFFKPRKQSRRARRLSRSKRLTTQFQSIHQRFQTTYRPSAKANRGRKTQCRFKPSAR